jgi:ubiquinone/menaquinone biosynthesis C-methylase UbiE
MKFAAILLAAALCASAQVAESANSGYKTKEGRERVATGLDATTRPETQKPDTIVAALKLKPGMTVCDVGTGTGFMLPYLSKAVGSTGRVFAEDIQTDFLEKARAHVAAEKLGNVSLILGTEIDPTLPAGDADSVLVLDAYHHFDYPDKMLAALARGLKPKGQLAIVEYYKSEGPSAGHIRLDRDEVANEVGSNGFKLISKVDRITDRQYLLLFEKK